MDEQNAANPPTVNIQDFYQHSTVNIGSNVDTERVMAKISEESQRMMTKMTQIEHMMARARIGTIQSDDLTMTSTREGIPSSETTASLAERKERERYIKIMREVFDCDDKTSSLLQSNQRNKFHQILKQKISLGKDLLYAKELVLFIITSMQVNSSEDISQLRKELFELLNANINIPGRAVESFADEFRSKEQFFEAILLYLLAYEFYANEANGANSELGIVCCCKGMWMAAAELIESVQKPAGILPKLYTRSSNKKFKLMVKQQILPLFSEVQNKIQGIENFPEEAKIVCKALNMLHVAGIQFHLKEYESVGESCKLGVEMMESKLPSSYMKHKVYGRLLFTLGGFYFNRQRLADTKRCWLQAAEAYNTAEDFESEDQRKEMIKVINDLLGKIFMC